MNIFSKYAKGTPLEDLRGVGGSNMLAANSRGELNAHDKKELIAQIEQMINASASGQFKAPTKTAEEIKAARAELAAAYKDPGTGRDSQWMLLGEVLRSEVQDALPRDGFARRLLNTVDIAQGADNRVRIKEQNIVAHTISSDTRVMAQFIQNKSYRPPKFEISSAIRITLSEIEDTPGDLLAEKYDEILQAVMVQEDLYWKMLADKQLQLMNKPVVFTTFTRRLFATISAMVGENSVPLACALAGAGFWTEFISSDFYQIFDPITQRELLLQGRIGTILGVPIYSDMHRHKHLRVIQPGDIYFVGAPDYHGVIQSHSPLLFEPVTDYDKGVAAKGWFFRESLSMAVLNPASVSKGRKTQ